MQQPLRIMHPPYPVALPLADPAVVSACLLACLPPVSHTVYFVQGILKLSSLAVTFFFKDTLKMEPAQVIGGRGERIVV